MARRSSRSGRPGLFTVAQLAWRDYVHEWPMSLCSVSALAAVLAPLLVLFGLKFGIVDALTQRLIEDPTTRQVRVVGQGRFDAAFFRAAQTRPDIGFVIPNTRFLAANAMLRSASGATVAVELVPTADGDPLLRKVSAVPSGLTEIVLTDSALRKLGATAGGMVRFLIGRTRDGRPQEAIAEVRVIGALPPQRAQGDVAYVPLDLLVATEDWRDGYSVAALGWSGAPPSAGERVFSSFRLFAATIYDVATLREWLLSLRLEVITRLDDIETVQAIDQALTLLFTLIAGLAAAGYSLSFAVGLLASTARKQRELSTLRLLGFHARGVALFPAMQALTTAATGCAAAVGLFALLAWVINSAFAEVAGTGQPPCRLLPEHVGVAVLITHAIALLASLASGLRAARIQPAEGLREE